MPELTQEAGRRIDAILDGGGAGRQGVAVRARGLRHPRLPRAHRAAVSASCATSREVDEEALRGFGHTLIVKIVSPEIPHKQKLGGVSKISAADPLYVQFVLSRMREEVLSHFPAGRAARASPGFLIVEYIPHTQALGYEVLIGFREDPAFGPVLTVSKGGDDAEFFAAHYDPANLFLPPMEYAEALAFTRSLHIRHKFEQIGHPEYLELMARAMAEFSTLALRYSPMAEKPRYVLKALEVNPFAISSDGRFVALDGLAEFGPAPAAEEWNPRVDLANLDAFFQPRGVAVIGVSADLSKYSLARDIAELLHELRRDDLYLVNPHGGTRAPRARATTPCTPTLAALPAQVELAVYAAPARNAPDFLRSLAGSSVRAVVLIPGVPSAIPYARVRAAAPRGRAPGHPGHRAQLHGRLPRGRRGAGRGSTRSSSTRSGWR